MKSLESIRHILRMKILFLRFFIILFTIFFLYQCQHARIRILPQLPTECAPFEQKEKEPDCVNALAKIQENQKMSDTHEITIPQKYYFWGLSPRNYELNAQKECPKGIIELHQFSTFMDGLYEQITFGIYSPRTLSLLCYK